MAHFDWDTYPPEAETTRPALNKAMVDAASEYAASRGEKVATYFARLVMQDMAQVEAEEPALAETGKEAAS